VIPVVGANLSGGRRLGPRDSLRPDGRVDVIVNNGAVEAEQTRLLLQNPVDVPANLINAGLVAVVVWPLYPAWVVALWLGLVCIVSLVRALLRNRYSHAVGEAKTSPNWARVFTLNAFVAGCLWGLSASVILMTADPIYYNFIIFVLGGTMAGGVVSIAANMRAMLAFILPTILPAIMALAVRGGLVQIEMAVMLALFTCALGWAGRSFNQAITENIRLRFEEQALVIQSRLSEAAMAESQALAHVGTWVFDIERESAVWSAETYRIFGVDPATFKPSLKAAVARIHPDDAETTRKDYETLLASGTTQGMEHRIVMDSGAIKDVHELGRVIYDSKGRPVQIVGSVQDVTTRRQGEAASASLAAIVDASVDAIYSEAVAGTILSWNRGAERLFGYRADEAIGKSIRMIIPEDRREEIDRNLAALVEGRQIDPFDTERQRKDGARIPVSIAVALTRDAARTVVGASFITRDISERRVAANALAYRDRLLHAVTIGTSTVVKAESLDLGMPEALRVVGEAMEVDRVLLLQMTGEHGPPMAVRYCWEVDGIQVSITGRPSSVDAMGPAVLAAWFDLLTHSKEVIVQFATSEGHIRQLLGSLEIKSTVLLPIFVGGVFWGALGADACTTAREWNSSEINTLTTFADIAGALIQRDAAEAGLAFANLLLRTQMEASLDGILIVDKNMAIVAFNQRFATIWKIPQADLAAGGDVAVLAKVTSSIKDAEKFSARVSYLYDHPGEDSQDEYETTDGRSIDRYTVTLYSPSRAYLGRAWFFRDITERKRVEALALRMARYDVLTGLANRAVFVEALQHAIATAKRGEKGFAVLYLDLDHFKDVNDTLGHPVGDELLKSVADRLRANTRETDTVARFGGDEFAIMVADTHDVTDAAILAEKLASVFAIPFSIHGSDIHIGASIGIASYGAEGADAETLLSHADVALYRAKSEGRGGYRFFTDAMDEEVQTRVTLGAELRVAIDQGQLFLLYQPQVAIDTGRITGLEALVRWRHPGLGVLGPDLFIPIAEQIGIIAKLGHWVLWEACRQGKAWLDAGVAPVRIAVNVSALQFRTPVALEADIAAALAQTGMPARMLELELTESVLIDAPREQGELLQRLRQSGVTVAIDDFGTGYSSLDYLRRYPSNRIKIAQNFVKNLETTPGDAAIIRATIGLARELKIDVIAEGVETNVQRDLLKAWGCNEVQGFLFARPLTAEDTANVLRAGVILPPKTDAV
jgi:diguanylate cyclase (GGDEF)-like protein/PAS domain S-box-containing protein